MKYFIIMILWVSFFMAKAQTPSNSFIMAKEWNKETSLYRAKGFVIKEVIGTTSNFVKFEIDPLTAATSGELTSLVYQCPEKNLEGLVLSFYGNYWNESGVVYQGYGFRNLPKEKAMEFLNKIQKCIDENDYYLNSMQDNNNVYFVYEDMTVLIYMFTRMRIRIFWNGFDADWENTTFKRTKRRLEKKLD